MGVTTLHTKLAGGECWPHARSAGPMLVWKGAAKLHMQRPRHESVFGKVWTALAGYSTVQPEGRVIVESDRSSERSGEREAYIRTHRISAAEAQKRRGKRRFLPIVASLGFRMNLAPEAAEGFG